MPLKIVISGVSRGLGLAMTQELLNRGHHVAGISRKKISFTSERFQLLEADITDERALFTAFKQLNQDWGHADLLIVNAGVYPESGDESFSEIPMEFYRQSIETNFLGSIFTTKASLELLKKSPSPRIVILGSGAGSISTKDDSRRYCYGPSKAALHLWARTLSFEFQPPKWVISIISPGWVRTDMGGKDADLSVDEVLPEMLNTILNLNDSHHGLFLDRFGNSGNYAW